ncbi:threonine-phosphate decarboxylase CobD/CbiB family domain protein [[Clostridium] sordellii ATCC 9714]|nr:threonine-phosphate decarboxylase CobD/CbiB family domain protein [[Clostridium] sordellii ATCC 9714] [Paeniclostridium sordellii ATCC 9714]
MKEEIFIKGNILIRDASNFRNLDDSYIRIAIKSHDENIKILKILNKILGE